MFIFLDVFCLTVNCIMKVGTQGDTTMAIRPEHKGRESVDFLLIVDCGRFLWKKER